MPLNLSAFETKEETTKKSNLNYSAFAAPQPTTPVPQKQQFDPTFKTQRPNLFRFDTPSFETSKSTLATSFLYKPDPSSFSFYTPVEERKPTFQEIAARNESISATPEKKSKFGTVSIKDEDIPPFVKTMVTTLKEGLFGRGQDVDLAGKAKLDT